MNNLVAVLLTICATGVVFLLFFLYALLRDMSRITGHAEGSAKYKDERLDSAALIREKRDPRRAKVNGRTALISLPRIHAAAHFDGRTRLGTRRQID